MFENPKIKRRQKIYMNLPSFSLSPLFSPLPFFLHIFRGPSAQNILPQVLPLATYTIDATLLCLRHITVLNARHLPTLSRMFSADGCHKTWPTRFWWCCKSTNGSIIGSVTPSSGICQIFTERSSEPLAMMLSLNGFHARSKTAALWPHTWFLLRSTRPVWGYERFLITNKI